MDLLHPIVATLVSTDRATEMSSDLVPSRFKSTFDTGHSRLLALESIEGIAPLDGRCAIASWNDVPPDLGGRSHLHLLRVGVLLDIIGEQHLLLRPFAQGAIQDLIVL